MNLKGNTIVISQKQIANLKNNTLTNVMELPKTQLSIGISTCQEWRFTQQLNKKL